MSHMPKKNWQWLSPGKISIHYEESPIEGMDLGSLFWPLMDEFFHLEPRELHGRSHRRVVADGHRAPGSVEFRDLLENIEKNRSRRKNHWPPHVAMLGGMLMTLRPQWEMPDSAVVQLYRDGSDWVGYHIDPEVSTGPYLDDTRVAIFSFGAPRSLNFLEMSSVSNGRPLHDPEEGYRSQGVSMASGSLLIMSGKTQRNVAHALPKMPSCKHPRLSVSFTWRPRYDIERDQADLPAYLAYADHVGDGVMVPFHVGTHEETLLAYAHMDDDERASTQIVLPHGGGESCAAALLEVVARAWPVNVGKMVDDIAYRRRGFMDYDAMESTRAQIICEAVRKSGSIEAESLAKALRELSDEHEEA